MNGAQFSGTAGLTAAQIYSTASYQSHNLAGIVLGGDNLTGWDFSNQNLTGAWLVSANLTSVNFTNALIQANFTHAVGFTAAQLYSTASYQAHNLSGIAFWRISISRVGISRIRTCLRPVFLRQILRRPTSTMPTLLAHLLRTPSALHPPNSTPLRIIRAIP